MLRKIIDNLYGGMMVELNLMLELEPRLRFRLGSALTIIFLSSVALCYLGFRPYLVPQYRYMVVYALLFMIALMISPFLFLSLIKKIKGWFMGGMIVVGWGSTYFALHLKDKNNISLMIEKPDDGLVMGFTIAISALFVGIWLLESLLKRIFEEKGIYEAEIIVAHEIQNQLLPDVTRNTDQYKVLGLSTQAREVGGDYFDVVDLPDGRLALAIGDVSGHNVAAGLLMAITKAAFRTELHYLDTPKSLAKSLNRTICDHSDKKMFVSFMCSFVDFKQQQLQLLNAGHLPMLHYCAASDVVVGIRPKGMALGMVQEAFFGTETISFQSGDRFLMFTDGLDETSDPEGNLYGLERIKKLFRVYDDPQAFYKAIRLDLLTFSEAEDPEDDITLIVMTIN